MADEYWNKIYEKLIDNRELLKLICFDTANQEILSWVRPNSTLRSRCSRFMHNGVIADKNGLVKEVLNYSANNKALRRIILLTWVDKNPDSMEFFKIPGNAEAIERLKKGEFGSIDKVRILSMIEPREGAGSLYKEIIEEADKEAKAKEELRKAEELAKAALSNAELEAAMHSKDMIAAPDTNNGAYEGNFNAVVYEELQKIKAALEILEDVNKQLKTENKELRSEQSKRKTELNNYSTKLEKEVNETKKLSSELAKEKDLNSSLTSQLAFAKAELASKPAETLSDSEIGDLRFKLDEALKENKELKKALSNREASLNRIKSENLELNLKMENASDQSQTIKNLKQRLAEYSAKENIKTRTVVGQLVSKARYSKDYGEKAGKKCWLFVSIIGQVYYLDLADIPANKAVPEEYMIASFDGEKLVSFSTLESEDRREVFGFIGLENGNGFLKCEEEQIPVFLNVTEKWAGRPARGVFLPELEDRNAGIYKIDILPDTAKLNKNEQKSAKKSTEKADKTEDNIKYDGQKVIVFGGDRVGLEYEKALNRAGLEAKWFSGFSLLSEISLGFGKPDLMIIVTKQVSHALLRELNAYAEKNSIPVAYSTRRGITSVLEIVKHTFK